MENPVEAAANELKKWIEQLKKIMAMMEAQAKAKVAEQKAIGDKALAAHKEMVAKTKHDELLKELKDIKEGIKNTPETPGKAEALQQAENLEKQAGLKEGATVDVDDLNEVAGPDVENALKDPDAVDVDDLNEVAGPEVENAFDGMDAGDNSVGDDLLPSGPQAGGRARSMSIGEKMSSKDPKPGSTLDMMRKGGDELEIVKDFEKGLDNKLGENLTKAVGKVSLG